MPGVLEDIAARLAAMEQTLAEVADMLRQQAAPPFPLLPEEEVWADGPLTVKEAADWLKVSEAQIAHLIRDGKLVSMKDGRRLIAKRGCVRYLLQHQEHQIRLNEDRLVPSLPAEQPTLKKGKK